MLEFVRIPGRGGYMANLENAVKSLVAEQKSLQGKLKQVEAAIGALRTVSQNGSGAGSRPKRVLSLAARRRIAAAQRARWAKFKAQKKAA
jgi:hypothetical protein